MKFPALLVALIVCGFNPCAQAQTLAQALAGIPALSNFTTLFGPYIPLAGPLANLTNITLLAPNDDAVAEFLNSSSSAALNSETNLVQAILAYHILGGIYSNFTNVSFIPTALGSSAYANVSGGQRIEALGGGNATFFSGLLQNSSVTNSTNFTGGVVHVIDRILTLPQNISSTSVALNLTSSVGAAVALNLIDTIDVTRDITYFVPNNAAFQRIGGNLANLSTAQLTDILSYHVVPGVVAYSTALTNRTSVQTLIGTNVTITLEGGSVYVNNARVILPNVLVSNGVVHVIDRVLNPDNTTAAVNTATAQEAFANPSSASNAPFTSGVATPTSAIGTIAASSAIASASSAAASPTSSSNPSPGSKSNTGAIAGGVVGGIVGIALIVGLIWFLRKKRSRSQTEGKQQNNAIAGGGGVGRAGTTKSYHKPELEAPNSPLGNTKTSSVPVMSEMNAPVSRTRTELSGTTALQGELPAQENQIPQQQQHSPPPPQQTQTLALAQQEQERLREQEAQEARMAELANQRRIAEIEHQKRMAQLDHERRMAELDISAARIRSQNRTISELEARANPGPGSAD